MNRHSLRSSTTGRFVKQIQVVNGRLYDLDGITVRARKQCVNGKRVVSVHNKLFGFVNDSDLQLINKRRVNKYLGK